MTLDAAGAERLRNGQRLALKRPCAVRQAYGPERKLLGVVKVDARGVIHPYRLIRNTGNTRSGTNSGRHTI
ncbi:MAG: tRNA pseudouridine(55) synthase TruB [Duodenibacillus massiliensis]